MNNDCNLCGDPIQRGMEVRIRTATYHPGCAVTVAKEKKSRGIQQCNECGESVAPGSGRFVNRVIDLNDFNTRKDMGKPFPEGDYICSECDSEPRENDEHTDDTRRSKQSDERRTLDTANTLVN